MRIISLLGLLLVVSCTAQDLATTSSRRDQRTVLPPGYDGGGGLLPGTDGGGDVPPLTGELPTIVALDWNKFPQDPGANPTAKGGRTWIVKTSGQEEAAGTESAPLRWMSEAAKSAGPGDLIRVYGGTYNEPETVELLAKDVVLTAAPGEQVVLQSGGSAIVIKGESGVVVNGINIKGCTSCIDLGIGSSTQRNVVISNLNIEGSEAGGVDGIRMGLGYEGPSGTPTVDGVLIKNVNITNANLAISCSALPCHSLRLEHVKIKGHGMSGGWGDDGIGIESGDNLLFYDVEVSDVSSDGIDTKASRVVVWGCNVHHVGNNGLKLWQSGDVVNTVIHDLNDDASIVAEAVDGVSGQRLRILHTTIANQNGGESYGLALGYDTVAAMANMKIEIINSIYYKSWGAAFIASTAQLTIKNSVFFGSSNGELLRREDSAEGAVRDGAGLASYGSGNLTVDPQLDARYHLGDGSPAANAGVALESSYPSIDAAGQLRVKGSQPDIGAFEDF